MSFRISRKIGFPFRITLSPILAFFGPGGWFSFPPKRPWDPFGDFPGEDPNCLFLPDPLIAWVTATLAVICVAVSSKRWLFSASGGRSWIHVSSQTFLDYCMSVGIDVEYLVAHTHTQNGLVESLIKHLQLIVRPLLLRTKLSLSA